MRAPTSGVRSHDGQGPGPAVFDAPFVLSEPYSFSILIQNGIKQKHIVDQI